jgi:flagellar biosynthetic protein FlhB
MDENEQNKSEQPTPFKLDRARRKGTVARGMDLGFLTSLAAFFGYAWVSGLAFRQSIAQSVHVALSGASSLADGRQALFQATFTIFSAVVRPIALMVGLVFFLVLLFEIVQTGFVFSGEPLQPDFSRLNPGRGLKRIFSLRLLIETGKQILKLCAYTTVGYLVIRGALASDLASITDGQRLAAALIHAFFRLLGAFLLLAIVFAVLDQLIVRRDFLKRMRMSRRELRKEHRDREGDPRLKQKRRQLHAEFAKASQSMRNLRKADVLIVNPSHIAIALRYEPRTMPAPLVVSAGTNQFALRLKRLAFIYSVPVVENRALAQELHRHSGLNRPIPDQSFKAVAAIYNAMRRQKEA